MIITGVIKNLTGTILYDAKAKAECFRRRFESVFTQDHNKPAHAASKAPSDSFTNVLITMFKGYQGYHMGLKAKPSKGPDGLPSFFLSIGREY